MTAVKTMKTRLQTHSKTPIETPIEVPARTGREAGMRAGQTAAQQKMQAVAHPTTCLMWCASKVAPDQDARFARRRVLRV